MFWSFASVFGICEFGERLSGTFAEINDVYVQFADWRLFPYKSRRMLTQVMMVAQKPIELRVFGSISCGRITFKDVNKIFNLNSYSSIIDAIFFRSPLGMSKSIFVFYGSSPFWKLRFSTNFCSNHIVYDAMAKI